MKRKTKGKMKRKTKKKTKRKTKRKTKSKTKRKKHEINEENGKKSLEVISKGRET